MQKANLQHLMLEHLRARSAGLNWGWDDTVDAVWIICFWTRSVHVLLTKLPMMSLWYKFALTVRGRKVKNGQIRLVTGCDTERNLTVASDSSAISIICIVSLTSNAALSKRDHHPGPLQF